MELRGLEPLTPTLPGAGRSRDQARSQGFRVVVGVVKGAVVVMVVGRILAVVATLVVNELVRVAYRGVGPVFASPVFCGVGC